MMPILPFFNNSVVNRNYGTRHTYFVESDSIPDQNTRRESSQIDPFGVNNFKLRQLADMRYYAHFQYAESENYGLKLIL